VAAEEVVSVSPVLAFSHQTGVRLAEVGFLWLVSAEMPVFKFAKARTIVAGVLLAVGGLLLIIATRWGGFG
jgi:hypothetical protein